MLRIREYRRVESLEEAYELNQKKTNRIIGGGLWMKIGDRNLMTAIDLSGLGLDQISETEDEFVIGCMGNTPRFRSASGIECIHRWRGKTECLSYRRSAVPQLCNRWWKHLWKIWFFRCTDFICGTGLLCGII